MFDVGWVGIGIFRRRLIYCNEVKSERHGNCEMKCGSFWILRFRDVVKKGSKMMFMLEGNLLPKK